MIAHIWEEFLNIVRQEAGSRVVETWFRAVQFVQWRAEEQTAYLLAPNQFVRNWLISNYTKLIQIHLSRLLHAETVKIYISVEAKEEGPQLPKVQPVAAVAKIEKERVTALVPQQNKQIGYLNKQYTFENFVVGPNNSLAYAAAQAVADHPGAVYNPLYIYGQSGLGKTHLMHAIGNAIKEKRSQAVVHYQTADRFVNEFISSIRFDKVHKFKQKYQNIDVLLIDDVQFIANKEQTQEAFFHIFNALYESHKQIILSSDMVPQSLQGIAERLRSRMSWGLITDIHAPKLETKIAILKRKAHMHAEVLPDDVATYIAQSVDHNIRELEGALVRVIAFGALTQQPVTLAVAQKVLQRIQPEKRIIDFDSIIEVMKKHFSCKPALLQAKSRNKDVVQMRQVAMFLMKKYTDKSLREIGACLGGKDHSTVMHAFAKIEQKIAQDHLFAQKLKQLEQDLVA